MSNLWEEDLETDDGEKHKKKDCKQYTKDAGRWIVKTIKEMTWKDWLKVGIFLIIVIAICLLLLFLPWEEWLGYFLSWVDSLGVWGPILLAEMYVICTICFVPGSILTIGAGFAFQSVWIGTIAVSVGSTIGCICAFLFGNTLVRGWVEKRAHKYEIFGALDTAVATKGWLIVLLLRLSPVIPFNLLNYALGLTKVGVIEYSLCSWIGMLPATVVYVYIGTTLSDLAQIISGDIDPDPLTISLFIIGLLSTVVALVIVTYFAKVQIQKVLRQAKEKESLNLNKSDIEVDSE